jgi:hypothetical protein
MFDPLLQDKEELFNVVTVLANLLPSPALLVFVAKPELFEKLDTIHLLLLLPGIGFSFMIVCVIAWAVVRSGRRARANRIRVRDGQPLIPNEVSKDWHVFTYGSGYSTMLLLPLTVWAYWHSVRLGASLVAWSLIVLFGSVLVTILILSWPLEWTNPRRGTQVPESNAR